MSAPLLDVRDLQKDFSVRRTSGAGREDFRALDGVSFSVQPGGSLAVVGESGSGKSTTARIVVGLERATDGTVLADGADWRSTHRVGTAERRRRAGFVQMVFQDPYQSLDRRQRIGEGLEEAIGLHERLSRPARRDRVRRLLDQVQLGDELATAYPRALSGGQRQRVAIARALAAEPRLLILDEAVAALDVSIQARILELLAGIRRDTGVAFLFISHDLAVVRRICDDVLVMRSGRIVESGTTAQVLREPEHPYTQELLASVPRRGWKPTRRRAVTEVIATALPRGSK